MTTRTRLTPRTLAAEARRLSGDIDSKRWALAELAAQAKADGVQGWAAVIRAAAPVTACGWPPMRWRMR